MNSAVRAAVRASGKAHFTDRTEPGDERGDTVRRTFSVRYQVEHRVLGWPIACGRVLRVWHHESAGPAECRLVVAHGALICVETRSEPGGVGQGDQIRLRRIDKGTNHTVSAVITNRLELDGALHALVEHLKLNPRESRQWLACTGRAAT